MRALEPPIIWILVAVVLVALAAALIVVASLRRSRARRRAAAWGPAAALEPARSTPEQAHHPVEPDPETVPLDLAAARTVPPPDDRAGEERRREDVAGGTGQPTGLATDDRDPDPVRPDDSPAPWFSHDQPPEDEPLAAPLFRPWTMQTGHPRADVRTTGAHPRHALFEEPDEPAVDDAPTDDVALEAVPAEADPAETDPADEVSAEHAVATSTAESEAAKDRLLAVLLRDPEAALRALEVEGGGAGTSAAQLLRAGLSPAQVARLVGVGEDELAAVVARGLGLLGRGQDTAQDTAQDPSGTSRTEEPGRSWANAGSAAGATTPTTG